jgi:hypothetical protein
MGNNGHLPTTWQVFSEWQRPPAEAIAKHLARASERLGGAPSHVVLHPDALRSLGVEVEEVQENGKRYTVGAWRGMVVLAVERRGRKGLASQVHQHDVWYGRNGQAAEGAA